MMDRKKSIKGFNELYTGDETLVLNGRSLPYTMVDFWRSNLSLILLNMTRGSFAEFLVSSAMEEHGFHAQGQVMNGTEPWDIDGPEIQTPDGKRMSRIEVKSTASVQIDTPDEKEPISLPDSQLTFSIRRAIDWNRPKLGPQRHSDVYVFCHYKATRKSDNMLDVGLWDFYVLPTWRIVSDPSLEKQSTISVYRLKRIGVKPVGFENLYDAIVAGLRSVEEQPALP